MTTKKKARRIKKKSARRASAASKDAVEFLNDLLGGPLTIGVALRALREAEEMSQIDFAKRLRISKTHLCDIEKGRKAVSPGRAARFAKVLKHSERLFVRLALQSQLEEAGLELVVRVDAA
jgi:DNA-binding transcriptional regulator YiaG